MQATVTLATTTFLAPVQVADTQILVASTTGLTPGVFVYANRELFKVVGPTGISTYVAVLRGQNGTATRRHQTADTLYIGRGDQFYLDDPVGQPADNPPVSPRINVLSGNLWTVQGDDVGPGAAARTWQLITTAQSRGALGVRVNTTTTPA